MWRAQIEQVSKATGSTFGITVFAIPFVGPLVGKMIHYLNEHPTLIFIPEGSIAADCSLRGGDPKHRPTALEQEWNDMEEAEKKLKERLETFHEHWKAKRAAVFEDPDEHWAAKKAAAKKAADEKMEDPEDEVNTESNTKTWKELLKELDAATEPYKKFSKTRGELWKEIYTEVPKDKDTGNNDYSLAEVRLKDRN